MNLSIYCDSKEAWGNLDDMSLAEEMAQELAKRQSPKMVSIRDDEQKKGDPARRTYKVVDGVMKWSKFTGLKIEIGETNV